MPRLMMPEEAAALLGVNTRTLERWSREGSGGIPAHPLGEGKRRLWRYFEHELLQWLEGRRPGKSVTNG